MAPKVCVESSRDRVESSRVGSAGEGGMGECARGREAGASEGGFLRRERVMSEMEVRISESDTASP